MFTSTQFVQMGSPCLFVTQRSLSRARRAAKSFAAEIARSRLSIVVQLHRAHETLLPGVH